MMGRDYSSRKTINDMTICSGSTEIFAKIKIPAMTRCDAKPIRGDLLAISRRVSLRIKTSMASSTSRSDEVIALRITASRSF